MTLKKTIKKTTKKIEKFDFKIGVIEEDFIDVFGRKPKDQEEFNIFGHLCFRFIESNLEWDVIYKEAKESMKRIKKEV